MKEGRGRGSDLWFCAARFSFGHHSAQLSLLAARRRDQSGVRCRRLHGSVHTTGAGGREGRTSSQRWDVLTAGGWEMFKAGGWNVFTAGGWDQRNIICSQMGDVHSRGAGREGLAASRARDILHSSLSAITLASMLLRLVSIAWLRSLSCDRTFPRGELTAGLGRWRESGGEQREVTERGSPLS